MEPVGDRHAKQLVRAYLNEVVERGWPVSGPGRPSPVASKTLELGASLVPEYGQEGQNEVRLLELHPSLLMRTKMFETTSSMTV